MNLSALFKRKPTLHALGDMRQALSEIETERSAALLDLESLKSKRIDIVLEGDDRASEAHENSIRAMQLKLERLDIQSEALHARIATAERDAERERIDRQRAEAEAAQQRSLLLQERYQVMAREMASLLLELKENDAIIVSTNAADQKAIQAGLIEKRAPIRLPNEITAWQPEGWVLGSLPPLYERVQLPHPSYRGRYMGDGEPIWPPKELDRFFVFPPTDPQRPQAQALTPNEPPAWPAGA